MQTKKIAGPFRIDSQASGAEAAINLPAAPGGKRIKNAHYAVKILSCSDTTNTRITLDLQHGPDGTVSAFHSSPIANALSASTFPNLVTGDSDSTKMIGEYLHPVLKIKHNTTGGPVSAMVEVYETRKPF